MGQYWKPVNVDKKEYVLTHDYDEGLKLMEHSYIGNDFMDIVEGLLSPGGFWHRCKLVWAGDYMDTGLFLPEGTPEKTSDGYVINLYSFVGDNKIKPDAKDLPKRGRYLVNHTKKVCLDLAKEKNGKDNLIIHPLSLLTCSGNGRGGGDYRPGTGKKLIGTWAGDEISLEYEPMYDKMKPCSFKKECN